MYLTFGTRLLEGIVGPPSQGSVQTLGTNLAGKLQGRLDSDWTFSELKMQAGPSGPNTPNGGQGPTYVAALNLFGQAATSTTIPQNSAYLIRKSTGVGGRRNQGRFYFPGVLENSVNDQGVIDASQIAGQNTAFANFLAEFDTNPTFRGMFIMHSYPPGTNGPLLPPTKVTSLICQPVIATQRRRLRR
jgi:hypothetical protein